MSQDASHSSGDGEESRNLFPEEHPHPHEEPWLMSYADMMTLLFGFFVLMYSFAAAKNQEKDEREVVAIRKELSKYFGGTYINPLEGVATKLEEMIAAASATNEKLAKGLNVHVTPEGLEVMVSSTVLFKVGEAEAEPEASELLHSFIGLVKESGQKFKIRVEGYTDDLPIRSDRYPSNWELSAARASSVIRMFEKDGFESSRLMAIGYGANREMVPNRDAQGVPIPENQAKNRRVVIFVTQDLTN